MNINEKIENLRLELKKLDPIVEKRFKTSKELENHVQKYKDEYQKAHNLFEQIQQLEWELKTPEEQKQYLKEEEISKLKREGKL